VPALLFGVAFANIFQGIPIDHNGIYHGTLFTLLNPYGLLGGILFVLLFMMHGALWISIKSEGDLQERAISTATKLWPILLGVVVIFLIASKFSTRLYDNYIDHPTFFIVILITVLALLSVRFFLVRKTFFKAWFASALTIVGTMFFGVIGLYPNLLPSSLNPRYSLTAFNSSSSPLTLKIMLIVVTIFIPVIIGFQIWAYNLFKGKVTEADLAHDEAY
jgi:cytochrome d ubiquinol oxidase subunit II